MKPGTVVVCVFLMLVALAHLIRIVLDVEVTIGEWKVPIWMSIGGIIGPLALSWLLWRDEGCKD